MTKSYPPDVIVLDTDSLLHVRMVRGKSAPRIGQAKSYRLAADTFAGSVVTPELANEAALIDTLKRLRMETGKWDRVSLLLPDSWFRINLVELPSIPDKAAEAADVVRWSLKRTLPIDPSELRIAYEVLAKTPTAVKVLVVSAKEKTLATIERVFADAGFNVILVEPVGLNIWNAITVREAATNGDRLFVYVRDTDFTTAVFRGNEPLFVRSRNLNPERTLQQEIRLSAGYLRDTLQTATYDTLFVAGNGIDAPMREELASAFNAPVRAISLRDYVEELPGGVGPYEAELTACTGVFTG